MLSEKNWTAMGMLWLIACIFVCIFFVTIWQGVVQHFASKGTFDEGTLPFLVFSSLALHGSILFGTGFYLWINEWSWSETFGFNSPHKLYALLLGVVAALLFLPVGMVLLDVMTKVLSLMHIESPPQAAVEEFSKTVSLGSRIYLIVFATVIAPVAEEVFFRGVLYRGLKQIGYPRVALWGTALAFAAIHKSLAIFVPLFILSLLLSWLYDKTRNLLASIAAHSVFNTLNVILLSQGDSIQDFFDRHFHHFS
jgi:membrane protease YdiL (CAAX protease family)